LFYVNSRAIIERDIDGQLEIVIQNRACRFCRLHFRCRAKGELLKTGDETTDIRWITTSELRDLMESHPLKFSDIDRAGIQYYLNQN